MKNREIGLVKQQGSQIHVFDTKGYIMFTKQGTLNSFTNTNVSVKNNSVTQVFDTGGYLKFIK